MEGCFRRPSGNRADEVAHQVRTHAAARAAFAAPDHGFQALVLAIIGFVPASVVHAFVTVPISFLAAIQIGLFRNVGDLAYLPVATTGQPHALHVIDLLALTPCLFIVEDRE